MAITISLAVLAVAGIFLYQMLRARMRDRAALRRVQEALQLSVRYNNSYVQRANSRGITMGSQPTPAEFALIVQMERA